MRADGVPRRHERHHVGRAGRSRDRRVVDLGGLWPGRTRPRCGPRADGAGNRTVIDRRPGGALLHPVALLSIALLIVNDHFLKPTYSNWITGKLSDFAGLVFFPLLLVSAWELLRNREPSRTALDVACVATAIGFTLAKTTTVGSLAFQ